MIFLMIHIKYLVKLYFDTVTLDTLDNYQ